MPEDSPANSNESMNPVERRAHYRVAARDVAFDLVTNEGQTESLIPVNTSAGGLKFTLEAESERKFDAGQEIVLRLKILSRKQEFLLKLVIVRVIQKAGETSCACRFLDPEDVSAQATPEFWQLFNRRASFRVIIPNPHPIKVKLVAAGKVLMPRMEDLCLEGLALRFLRMPILDINTSMTLTFQLWRSEAQIEVEARVCHITKKELNILGAKFTSNVSQSSIGEVSKYVARAQAQTIRDQDR